MTPPYVAVKNLEKYQHYKHRNPPWVKLHYSLLDDPAFLALNEVQQCRYIKLIMLASRQMNCISTDPSYLGRVMRISEKVDLTPLINSGFLLASRKRQSSKMLAPPHENTPSELFITEITEKSRDRVERECTPPTHGEFQNVLLTSDQLKKLQTRFGETEAAALIERLSRYIEQQGKSKYKSHYAALLTWGDRDKEEGRNGTDTHQQELTRRAGKSAAHAATPGKYAHLGTILDTTSED